MIQRLGPAVLHMFGLPRERTRARILRIVSVHGLAMGVLEDGRPFLTGDGLSRLCGTPVDGTGEHAGRALVAVRHSGAAEAVRLTGACMATLAGLVRSANADVAAQARHNLLILEGERLSEFVRDQATYAPRRSLSDAWRRFHERMTLVYNYAPIAHFSVAKEIADLAVSQARHGQPLPQGFAVSLDAEWEWSQHWASARLDDRHGPRCIYLNAYPPYLPTADGAAPARPACYPADALPEFRAWLQAYLANAAAIDLSCSVSVAELMIRAADRQAADKEPGYRGPSHARN